jgi:hypothetical protein
MGRGTLGPLFIDCNLLSGVQCSTRLCEMAGQMCGDDLLIYSFIYSRHLLHGQRNLWAMTKFNEE